MESFNLTSIGASHIRAGKECQDFSLSETAEYYSMAISCDGHGGDNYFRSAIGSRLAAQAASSCIAELMRLLEGACPDRPEETLIQLEKSIIAAWNGLVWEHFEAHPFSEDELAIVSESRRKRLESGKSIESTYGTTLIAIVATEAYWFGIQIGDGKCVRIKSDGQVDQPIPANEKCFLNSTTSLCDESAIDDFRHVFDTDLPLALFCGSDGIDDSFVKDEQLFKLYLTIARSFGNRDYNDACAELEDYLPRLSMRGSGDDVSIAGIFDADRVRDVLGDEEIAESHSEETDSFDDEGSAVEVADEEPILDDPESPEGASNSDEAVDDPATSSCISDDNNDMDLGAAETTECFVEGEGALVAPDVSIPNAEEPPLPVGGCACDVDSAPNDLPGEPFEDPGEAACVSEADSREEADG